MNPILATIATRIAHRRYTMAWDAYKPTLLELAKGKDVLEIGAGRSPLFTPEEIQTYNIRYTANDIWQSELDRITFPVQQACFDVTQNVPDGFANQYDLVFSKMVQEHVKDGPAFYTNLHRLLRQGGVSLQFHPTLFHPVFILNYLMPEDLSSRLLKHFFPNRTWDDTPKFPAYYRECNTLHRQVARLRSFGFSEAKQFVFYGQGYFNKIPFFKQLAQAFDGLAERFDLRVFSTYAYSVVIK